MVLKAIEILKWRTPMQIASGRSAAIGMGAIRSYLKWPQSL